MKRFTSLTFEPRGAFVAPIHKSGTARPRIVRRGLANAGAAGTTIFDATTRQDEVLTFQVPASPRFLAVASHLAADCPTQCVAGTAIQDAI
jgi:hypothetical protein